MKIGVKKIGVYNLILIIIILVALILLFFQNAKAITGHATEGSTVSNVTIEKYLSITLCTNLAQGIIFGNISALPATDLNASHNYDGVSSNSTLCVNVSDDGNTAVDFCSKADGPLNTTGGDEIGLGNETYLNASSTVETATIPGPASGSTLLTTSYVKSGNAIPAGGLNYYRFWLDIPAAQASGDYNNTVYFKGVTTTLSC